MDKKVVIRKNGKVIAEIPMTMFPLEVSATIYREDQTWGEKSYTWLLSYWRDENLKKQMDKPKGTQLS